MIKNISSQTKNVDTLHLRKFSQPMSESQWFNSGEENATIEFSFWINRLHRNRYFLIGLCCDSYSFQFLLGTTVTPREIEDNGYAKILEYFEEFWLLLRNISLWGYS